jgi:DnaJ-class molecular chaperone
MSYQSTNIATQSFLYHAPESCAWCGASGLVDSGLCPACDGKGYVVIIHPKTECWTCKGSGRSPGVFDSADDARCVICKGCGWLTIEQRK